MNKKCNYCFWKTYTIKPECIEHYLLIGPHVHKETENEEQDQIDKYCSFNLIKNSLNLLKFALLIQGIKTDILISPKCS